LSGQAAEVLWTAGAESSDTYEKLLSLLRNRFGSDGQAEKFRAELRTRRRRPGESLRALFHDVRRLIALAYPGPMNTTTEIVARDAFIDALDNRQLSLRVREKEPITLEEALRVAIRFEADAGAADADHAEDSRRHRPRQVRGAVAPSSESDSLMSKIRQMEADRRKSVGLLRPPIF